MPLCMVLIIIIPYITIIPSTYNTCNINIYTYTYTYIYIYIYI